MPFEIVRNDITKIEVDAVVNAANTALKMGGGVCGAIFAAAGVSELQRACDEIGGCATGEAVITGGYGLPAKYIVHTPGPVWSGGQSDEPKLLYACYANSLALARSHGCESIAFPLISSGIFGYPKDLALEVATAAISDFLRENDMTVYLVVFDRAAFSLSVALMGDIQSFIDEHYVDESPFMRGRALLNVEYKSIAAARLKAERLLKRSKKKRPPADKERPEISGEKGSPAGKKDAEIIHDLKESAEEFPPPVYASLSCDMLRLSPDIGSHFDAEFELEEPFAAALLRMIDERGMSDVEIYKRANIDRRHFSKIRSNPDYTPSKKTALALAVALRLSLDETQDLLRRAGYVLSHSYLSDVIIEYFITNASYDIFKINEALFSYEQPILGA